jgi:hypothetical protein
MMLGGLQPAPTASNGLNLNEAFFWDATFAASNDLGGSEAVIAGAVVLPHAQELPRSELRPQLQRREPPGHLRTH